MARARPRATRYAVLADTAPDVAASTCRPALAPVPEQHGTGVRSSQLAFSSAPGAGHLEQVFVLQLLRRGRQPHCLLSLVRQSFVERGQTLVVAARLANEDLLAREIVDGCDPRPAGTRDHDLLDA